MKVWLDDLRPAPKGWVHVKTSQEALDFLTDNQDKVTTVSFDHDLGGDDTSRRVVLWMCENDWFPPVLHVHTANPVGREWLEGMINRYGPGVTR